MQSTIRSSKRDTVQSFDDPLASIILKPEKQREPTPIQEDALEEESMHSPEKVKHTTPDVLK